MSQFNIAVVIGNPSETSRTKVLALALAEGVSAAVAAATPQGAAPRTQVVLQVLELGKLTPHLFPAPGSRELPAEGAAAVRSIEQADLVIAATPVYKASYTGLFKHLFDLVDPNALVERPVLLAANGGSDRHALVVDHQLRPLFSFFRALTVPSAVYASEADFDGYSLRSAALIGRVEEAAGQAARLLLARQALADLAPALRAA